jgi:hypothetical protein
VTITDAQREIAAAVAADRQARHDQAGHTDNRMDVLRQRGEQHRRGLLGEFEFCAMFGGLPDLGYRPRGDEHDHTLILKSGRPVQADVKTSSYWGADPYIRVQAHKCDPVVVYVAARYHAGRDDVQLVGWITGAELLARHEIRRFTTINNYTAPYDALHPMEALAMIVCNRRSRFARR